MGRFDGKIAIITGSSNGIGRAAAILFAKEGAKVTITGRNTTTLAETKSECIKAGAKEDDLLMIAGDMTDEAVPNELVEKTINKFGKLDILVGNHGGSFVESNEDGSWNISTFDPTFHQNTKSPFYAMAKAALDHLTRILAYRHAKDGVRVNCIEPGFITTAFLQKLGVSPEVSAKLGQFHAERTIPMRRVGIPDDIAEPIAFLADSKVSGYMTGQCIAIDGGVTLQHSMITYSIDDVVKQMNN